MAQLELDLPAGYAEALEAVNEQVRSAQLRAQRIVNTAMLELYWGIGRTILDRQAEEQWGSRVLQRMSADLRSAFPHMKGFSPTSVKYMRRFAAEWGRPGAIGQQPADQLAWGHIMVLIDEFDDTPTRQWYAAKAVERGWSRPTLEHQIKTGLHVRSGSAPNNLEARLPGRGTDLAREVAKDPLVLDFLGLSEESGARGQTRPVLMPPRIQATRCSRAPRRRKRRMWVPGIRESRWPWRELRGRRRTGRAARTTDDWHLPVVATALLTCLGETLSDITLTGGTLTLSFD